MWLYKHWPSKLITRKFISNLKKKKQSNFTTHFFNRMRHSISDDSWSYVYSVEKLIRYAERTFFVQKKYIIKRLRCMRKLWFFQCGTIQWMNFHINDSIKSNATNFMNEFECMHVGVRIYVLILNHFRWFDQSSLIEVVNRRGRICFDLTFR